MRRRRGHYPGDRMSSGVVEAVKDGKQDRIGILFGNECLRRVRR